MLEEGKSLLLILTALFPLVNPLGSSPFFLALTRGYAHELRKALSWRIAINTFYVLVASYFVGTQILRFFGISLPVVQLGGGLLVISTGWTLLKKRDDEKEEIHRNVTPQETFRQALYPLAFPLTVGPGSVSVAITLGANAAQQHGLDTLSILVALVASGLIALSVFLAYGYADGVARILGSTGTTVIMRLSSFLLICIGVQITWNGMKALLESLALHVG